MWAIKNPYVLEPVPSWDSLWSHIRVWNMELESDVLYPSECLGGESGGPGVAFEAFGAFAALSRCGGCYNGGLFMGIQANGFLCRDGHCSYKQLLLLLSVLWVRPSLLAASYSDPVSFCRAEPNPLPAFITLHPPKRKWKGRAAEFILFSEMLWGERSELAVPHAWREPQCGNQKWGEQQWLFCDGAGSGQCLGGPHGTVHLLLQSHADRGKRDWRQAYLHLRARWAAWVPWTNIVVVVTLLCTVLEILKNGKVIHVYWR